MNKNKEDEKGYRKLFVWQKADELAHMIYLATRYFPREEIYGLTSQLRRASLSVPVNLVEGAGRQNRKESKQFVNIALGSLAETEYLLGFSLKLLYFDLDVYEKLENLRHEVGALLWKLYLSL